MKQIIIIIIILALTSAVCCNVNRQVQKITQGKKDVLLETITKCIRKAVVSQEVRDCPNYDEEDLLEYYKNELSHFSINKALDEIGKWSEELQLKKGRDTIVLSLYYPMVGFDPREGYQTEYYIFGNTTKEGVVGKFIEECEPFAVNRSPALKIKEEIGYYLKLKSGCETGFLVLTYMSPDFKPIDCHSTIGSSPFAND